MSPVRIPTGAAGAPALALLALACAVTGVAVLAAPPLAALNDPTRPPPAMLAPQPAPAARRDASRALPSPLRIRARNGRHLDP